ncbi:polyribonucleotide nucleotidyltransferase [Sulfurovum riftiae]|uniref:Polyribonucleotide nucleotidyltransferase n=1 Tax=Sulfurovum riftiae TaxID=1630136 RepID=A0A151CFG3_9BACT|nr:polyribonucleotide nucleotidyltransferase [Sulfurovum riftiae]KYJ86261.1 polyribonucleotide nucleotidyltransferase [Sulfurovum riftiae]
MSEQIIEINLNNLDEKYEFDKIAKQASGAVMYRQGKAVLIAAVAVDEKAVDEDFLPLTVQYMERSYAAAKIPGGFIKRETKPGDFETLTSRIVDRSLRPLFPKGFHYPVTISVMVVSADSEVDMQVAALHAANAALYVSDISVQRSIAAVRVGKIDEKLVINPTLSQQDESVLDLLVVGSEKDIIMIEMRTMASEKIDDIEVDMIDPMMGGMPLILEHQECNELNNDDLVEAIALAGNAIEEASMTFEKEFAPLMREGLGLELAEEKVDETLYTYIEDNYREAVEKAIAHMAKSERSTELKKIRANIMAALEAEGKEASKEVVSKVLEKYKATIVRAMILEKGMRADGRGLDEVRPITIETNILPSVHGSCLFTRGQTQALVTATLGDKKDAQMFELITDKNTQSENFMVHYNFPGYSVGDAKFIGAPGRRELGHGNLAKRALEPVLPLGYDGTIRLVSEILESNGSSSMATICGGALALRAAEVEMVELVAGIAMGLVTDGQKYAVLTDIMGLEDHDGDMDFKIAGTRKGITALQMDIKLGGIDLSILKDALEKAAKGKEHILDLMEEAEQNMAASQALPSTEFFSVHPGKIADIIGKAGATIRDIIEKFEVSIDLDRDKGGVKLSGHDKEKVAAAKEHIEKIANAPLKKQMSYEVGKSYQGKVKRIVDFGVFVEMPDGFDALLHISKVAKERVNDLHERYHEGDDITVVVMEQKGKKVELATPEYLA